MECLAVSDQVIEETINECRFSESDIATDEDDASMALLRLVKRSAECIALLFTTYDVVRTAIGYGADNARGRLIVHRPHGSDESVPRFRNGLDVSVIAGLLIE